MLELKILDVVILLNCNLSCRGCNNFCDHNVAGTVISLENIKKDFKNWHNKINPERLQIMGGEPVLHKDLINIIKEARKWFPNTDLRLFTNGLLLYKYPKLFQVLQDNNCMLVVSVHSKNKSYLDKLYTSLQIFLKDTLSSIGKKSIVSYGKIFNINNVNVEIRDMASHWYQTYKDGVVPFNDNNPRMSWEKCYFKYCTQLYEGKLWKCSQIAYLEPLMERINNTKVWEPYRNTYKPLSFTDSEDKFNDFKLNIMKEEHICNMCPSNITILKDKSI